jgi:mono/diheme cytochrome c family protein
MHPHRVGKIRVALIVCGAVAAITCASMTTSFPSVSVHAQDSIDGKKIYDSKCASCHGIDGKISTLGLALGSKDLRSAEAQQVTDVQMKQLISEGKDKMPAYKNTLSADEISAVIKYLRTLKMDDGSAKQ